MEPSKTAVEAGDKARIRKLESDIKTKLKTIEKALEEALEEALEDPEGEEPKENEKRIVYYFPSEPSLMPAWKYIFLVVLLGLLIWNYCR